MSKIVSDITKDIPRGVPTRYLKQQTVPQARFQDTDSLLKSSALSYDPANPGSKILFGALGDKLLGIEDNRHIMTVAGSRAGKSVTLISNLLFYQWQHSCDRPKGRARKHHGGTARGAGTKGLRPRSVSLRIGTYFWISGVL